jgi:hypothetical protein
MAKVAFVERETQWLNKEKGLCLLLAVLLVTAFVKYLLQGVEPQAMEVARDAREHPRLYRIAVGDPPFAFDGPKSLYPGRRWRPTPFEYEKPPVPLRCRVTSVAPNSGPPPLTVSFSYRAEGGSGEYQIGWEFGDGQTVQGPEPPQHVYHNAGVFPVRLSVTDSEGARADAQAEVRVGERPPAALRVTLTARPSQGLAPLAVEFQARVTGAGRPYTCAWEFGDGENGTGERASHVYRAPGRFNARLTVRENTGREAGTNAAILVQSPQATPTPSQPAASHQPTPPPAPEFPLQVIGTIEGLHGRVAEVRVKADGRVLTLHEGDTLKEFNLRVEKILPSRVDFRNLKTLLRTPVYLAPMLLPPGG